MTEDQPPRQCARISRHGKERAQCTRRATQGDYCGWHANTVDPRAVRASLYDHLDNAIDAVGSIVADPEGGDPDRARHDANRLKAAQIILDRTGHGPGQSITIEDGRRQLDELLAARDTDTEDGVPD